MKNQHLKAADSKTFKHRLAEPDFKMNFIQIHLMLDVISTLFHSTLISGNVSNFEKAFEGTEESIFTISRGFYSGLWAYDGW